MSLLVARAEVLGRGTADVRLDRGLIVDIDERLRPRVGEDVIDAAGGALVPGLHDHHVHLRAAAAAASSVRVGPPEVRSPEELVATLRAAVARLPAGEWLRAVGYHESVAGLLDRATLDELVLDRPLRVQHRSGSLWVLNSPAIALAGVDACDAPGVERDVGGRPTGRLWRTDEWLRGAVPPVRADLGELSRSAAVRGVTGFTDATPDRTPGDAADLAGLTADGTVLQRLHLMCPPGLAVPPGTDRVGTGPVKILLDDDHLPTLDELTATIAGAHRHTRTVAVHCVTQAQLVIALAALRAAGPLPGDRIEHGSVIAEELIADIRQLGLTVVTQPNFVAERGDEYLETVEEPDRPSLYRCASLLRAGIPTAAGTDAPFGILDPWAAMRAAVDRRTQRGAVVGPAERIEPMAALRLFLGAMAAPARPRSVAIGASADLCVLRAPLAGALRELTAALVAVTIVTGQPVAASGA